MCAVSIRERERERQREMHVSLFEIPPKTQKPDGYGTGNSLDFKHRHRMLQESFALLRCKFWRFQSKFSR